MSLPTPPEPETRSVTYERRAGGRPKLPAQLPRVRTDYDLSEEQKAGYRSIERIGEELSETLDYIPARLQVVQHVRAKYAVRALDGQAGVVTAAMPAQPLPKSNAGPGLLAHVLVSKYADHLPLNRIEKILRRHGAEIARQTLCDWVLGSTQLLERLYEALKAHVLAAPKIHADDTVIKLADRATNRSVQARLRAYLGAGSRPTPDGAWQTHPAAVIYEFTPDRKAEHPRRMLAGYQGYNFLCVGSESGGRAAAIAYSLIETCKLHGVEPYAYLKAVITRLPEHRVNRIAELLPFNFQPQG